jgi:hypothetical protein
MKFESKDICLTHNNEKYTVSVCFNGEFYQARVIHPPMPQWSEIGIGNTEDEAITVLMAKLERLAA